MNRIGKTVSLVAFLAPLSAGPAFTQTPSDEAIVEATTKAPVAYVYVQTIKGVNVYDAASDGKLALVKGSPFATVGQMQDINDKYLISVGTEYLHAYAIEPYGGVGRQVSEIDTQAYSGGAACPDTSTTGRGSILDRTGKYLYVQIGSEETAVLCSAWQSFKIASNGEMTFLGDIDSAESYIPMSAISGNDHFAYGAEGAGPTGTVFSAFARD